MSNVAETLTPINVGVKCLPLYLRFSPSRSKLGPGFIQSASVYGEDEERGIRTIKTTESQGVSMKSNPPKSLRLIDED